MISELGMAGNVEEPKATRNLPGAPPPPEDHSLPRAVSHDEDLPQAGRNIAVSRVRMPQLIGACSNPGLTIVILVSTSSRSFEVGLQAK